MLNIKKAKNRYEVDHGWLRSYHLFSFGDYVDPKNTQFGDLRVFNEDFIKGNSGFPMHPHSEMEIVTILLKGELTHEDDMGHKETIRPGQIQRFSAGSGIVHSEFNEGSKEVHLYQLWFYPIKKNIDPNYSTHTYNAEKPLTLLAGISSKEHKLNSNADLYLGNLKKGEKIQENSKRIFIYITSGELQINGKNMEKNDQARIEDEVANIEAISETKFILIKMQ